MMTSLERQLKRLRSQPGTHHLAVERDRASLLFTPKESAAFTREDFLKLARDGLNKLARFDPQFTMATSTSPSLNSSGSSSYEPQLFTEESLQLNRGMLLKEQAAELDESLEIMLLRLCPYFQHQACKQVLEWLIHHYQEFDVANGTLADCLKESALIFTVCLWEGPYKRESKVVWFEMPSIAKAILDSATGPLFPMRESCWSEGFRVPVFPVMPLG